jgi:hypothetical protein
MSEVAFLVGTTLSEVRYWTPAGLRLVFDAGKRVEPALYADLETTCEYLDRAGSVHEIDPEEATSVGPVLASVGQRVDRASTTGGRLELSFSDGARLRCDPHAQYEAWHIAGGFPQHLVVCLPGGELGVWDDKSKVETVLLEDLRSERS